MRAHTEFAPMWAVPPGRTISDLMDLKGISPVHLARSMMLEWEDFDRLLAGERALTANIAMHLEQELGASIGFWLAREEQYRTQQAEILTGVSAEDEEYKAWLKSLPIKQMRDLGWLDLSGSKDAQLKKCLEFFDVPNLDAWRRTYAAVKETAAFRTTDAHSESGPATAAWLRQGERLAERITCQKWDPAIFEEKLPKIRELTHIAEPAKFLPILQYLCAEAGVAVVVVKAPNGCRASGATFFSSPTKAVLLLSFRYLSNDQFWFSFFHEAAHLVLHWNEDLLILETSDGPKSPREDEANQFASDFLISPELQKFLPEAAKSAKSIIRFSRLAGVASGIVVGQMQYRGLVRRDHFNKLKNRYKWESL
ncbi:ImmA/IrrE family metallo-endopeptidase [Achromobacter xylosoxidans]|uniref:ImmA/IrrE family metallo-endopeptidase n=1 Tax=Alcaligenes xylosoxydans xylosoxydans TaxID=85698 RepID=UPI001EEB054A|nr:ImmA/IrrE family metallo-endopeptidase [Achromobacter xylosoxidans]